MNTTLNKNLKKKKKPKQNFFEKNQRPKNRKPSKTLHKTNDFQLFWSVSLRLSSLITPLPRLKPYTKPLTQKERESRDTETEKE